MAKVKDRTGNLVVIQTIQILRLILRAWKLSLTAEEWEVLLFIFDRTLGWQKLEEAIPHHHFLQGLRSDDGLNIWAAPLYQAQSTLSRTLGSLRRKGVVRVSQPGGPQRWRVYSINLQWDYHRWTRRLVLEDFEQGTPRQPLGGRGADSYEGGAEPLRHRGLNLVSSKEIKPPKAGSSIQAGKHFPDEQGNRKKIARVRLDARPKARIIPKPKSTPQPRIEPSDSAFRPWDDDVDTRAPIE